MSHRFHFDFLGGSLLSLGSKERKGIKKLASSVGKLKLYER